MSVRNLEDVVAQHTRARRRQRAVEVDAFPVRRDPGGGVTDPEWTLLGPNVMARAIADTVWLLGQPRSAGADGILPVRLWPSRTVAVVVVDFDDVIGLMQASAVDGVVSFGGAYATRATATATWPLRAVESGEAPA